MNPDSTPDLDTTRYTIALEDDAATEPSLTGGKGANLAHLDAAAFTVPAGFCVTTTAYRTLIADAAIERLIRSLEELDPTETDQISARSGEIRESIRQADFPDPVRHAIGASLAELDTESVSVRSSATAEDLPTASFAGQHETYLNVPPTAVLERVRECMASLYTDRAVTYRLRNGVPSSTVALAVVVQEMVDADVAGVLFTADPISENRQIASIDANYGLGESIVAGEVAPDNIRVDRRSGELLSYEVGEKSVRVDARERGGIERVESANGSHRALTEQQVARLIETGKAIEDVFGSPQDIEWAFDTNELFILQSRPITSLFPLVTPPRTDTLLHVYLSIGHQQAMPEALPPLVIDFWRSFIDDAGSRFRTPEKDEIAAEAGHRVYADLTPLLRVGPIRDRLPNAVASLSEPASSGLHHLLDERGTDFARYDRTESIRTVGRGIRRAWSFVFPTGTKMLQRFTRSLLVGIPTLDEMWTWSQLWGEEHARRIRTPRTVEGRVQAAFDETGLALFLQDIAPQGAAFLPGILAGQLLSRLFPDARDEIDAVGKGFDDELVTQMNYRLGELADLARASSEIEAALESGAALPEIRMVVGGEAFMEQFDAFMTRFGHRATGEIDLCRPRWRDDPTILLQTIQSTLEYSTAGKHREHLRTLKENAATAENSLVSQSKYGVWGPVRSRVVRHLIHSYRKALPIREFPKQGMAHTFAAAHDVFAEAGAELTAKGQLQHADDVWFLRREEVVAGLNGDPIRVDIEARRQRYEQDRQLTAPPLLTSDGEQPSAGRTQTDDDTLIGAAVSAGVVEGIARVVRDPVGERLKTGEILIAPSTDPGWTPLFLNIGGLVMEVGGKMTHGALVAREYGIPAVASISNATTAINTGDRIRIDGAQGTVEILERGSNEEAEERNGDVH